MDKLVKNMEKPVKSVRPMGYHWGLMAHGGLFAEQWCFFIPFATFHVAAGRGCASMPLFMLLLKLSSLPVILRIISIINVLTLSWTIVPWSARWKYLFWDDFGMTFWQPCSMHEAIQFPFIALNHHLHRLCPTWNYLIWRKLCTYTA